MAPPSVSQLKLEIFVRVRAPNELHFYAQDASFAELAPLVASEVKKLDVVVYRVPPALLNANYWEPFTREAEAAIRDKMTGLITKQEGDQTLLWRSDAVAPGRLLRDGLDIPAELVLGYALRTTGEGVIALGKAWTETPPAPRDRFEWMGFASLPEERLRDIVLAGHNDLTAFRFSAPEARLAYAGSGDRRVRLMLTERKTLRRLVGAALRAFMVRGSGGRIVAIPPDSVCDDVITLIDGLGMSATAETDFIDKNRSYEFLARLGRTEWGRHPGPEQERLGENPRITIYYDRIAGLWAAAH